MHSSPKRSGVSDQNTGEARRAVYERARKAQVTQLRAIRPPLSELVIAKERLSLESAIRDLVSAARHSTFRPRKAYAALGRLGSCTAVRFAIYKPSPIIG